MQSEIKALLVMASERRLPLLGVLEACGIVALVAGDCKEARQILKAQPSVQVVLTETVLPDGDWCTLLEEVVQGLVSAAVVVCARIADEKLWCEVLNRGGYDLLSEPYTREEVQWVMEGAAGLRGCPRATASSSS